MTRNYFNNFTFYLVPFICGLVSTFSLPPYNFFYLNFVSFPLLLFFYLSLELKKSSTAPSASDSELQGFGKNEILGVPLKRIAKYDVFWKWLNFKQFLGSQLEAPQFLRDTRKKNSVFLHFCNFPVESSQESGEKVTV